MIGDLIAGLLGKTLDKIWPDPLQKAQIAVELEKMRQAGDFKEIDTALAFAQMQTDVNKEEAKSSDRFTSRARPFCIWMGGVALGYSAIVDPFIRYYATVFGGYVGVYPVIDTTITLQVLLGLLGLGGMRSWDKKKGAAS